ncbi:MAG TPA: hypothetical protein VFM88_03630 [Vicinamibacteria bacterium]|nr:hypothetical protein [Vicinamibacteria bacterium]
MASAEQRPRKACCLVSEVLEEAGLDRRKARQLRKQVLEGVILLCQWQLERLRESEADAPPPKRGRKVAVE